MRVAVLSLDTRSLSLIRAPLLRRLAAEGNEIVLLAPKATDIDEQRIRNTGVRELVYIPNIRHNALLKNIHGALAIFRALRNSSADAVICIGLKCVILGTIGGIASGIPLRYVLINGLGNVLFNPLNSELWRSGVERLWSLCVRLSTVVIFQNTEDREIALRQCGLLRGRTLVVNGSGIELEKFQPMPFTPQITFTFVGRLLKTKGISEFIEASRLMTGHRNQQVRFICVGDIDANPDSLGAEEAEGIFREASHIKWVRFVDDIQTMLRETSVLVLPTYYGEGIPRVILEAMACGRPVVTTDWPGCRTAILHETNGLLVPPKNTAALEQAMQRYVDFPELIRLHGRNGRERAVTHFDAEDVAIQMTDRLGLRRLVHPPGGNGKRFLLVSTVPATVQLFMERHVAEMRKVAAVDFVANGASSSCEIRAWGVRCFDGIWERRPLMAANAVAMWDIYNLVKRVGYDIVITQSPIASFYTRLAIRNLRHRTKVIYTVHGFHFLKAMPWYKNATFIFWEKLAGKWTDRLVVINREDAAWAQRLGIVPRRNLRHISGIGVDFHKFQRPPDHATTRCRLRRELGIDDDVLVFLSVGELVRNKRHQDTIRAFARANLAGKLLIAGEGGMRQELADLIGQLGKTEDVRLLGFRRDIPDLLAAADVFVFVTEREGLPVSLLEAIGLGLPCIATDVRGNREVLSDMRRRLLRVGDIAQIAAAMTAMTDSASRDLYKVSVAAIVRRYGFENIVPQYRAIWTAFAPTELNASVAHESKNPRGKPRGIQQTTANSTDPREFHP